MHITQFLKLPTSDSFSQSGSQIFFIIIIIIYQAIAAKANNLSTSSCPEEEDISLSHGAYEEKYTTLQSIGKGAFGFVKMATRKQDGTLVSEQVKDNGHYW